MPSFVLDAKSSFLKHFACASTLKASYWACRYYM